MLSPSLCHPATPLCEAGSSMDFMRCYAQLASRLQPIMMKRRAFPTATHARQLLAATPSMNEEQAGRGGGGARGWQRQATRVAVWRQPWGLLDGCLWRVQAAAVWARGLRVGMESAALHPTNAGSSHHGRAPPLLRQRDGRRQRRRLAGDPL